MDDATIVAALRSLRDVAGVLGSFLLDREGRPVVADLPAMFDEAALIASGERLLRLRAALESGGQGLDGCTSRFGEHLLVMRPVQTWTLCVLGLSDVSHATLQMGLNLVVRRLGAVPSALESAPPPPADSITRFFRGRPL
jgi:hypothetical protein